MKRGLECVAATPLATDLSLFLRPVPDAGLYFAEVTEGLEFIAAGELRSKLKQNWLAMGGKDEPQMEDCVRFQEGNGLVFFHLPNDVEANEAVGARASFLSELMTVETVFTFVSHTSGLPQDDSGLLAIEECVKQVDGALWDQALAIWALHFGGTHTNVLL